MSVHSTSPIMSMSEVQVIPMEENRRQSWAEGGPKTSGYNIHQQDNDGTYPIILVAQPFFLFLTLKNYVDCIVMY